MSETYTPEECAAVAADLKPAMRRCLERPLVATTRTANVLRDRGLLKGYERTARGEAVAAYLREKEQTR